MATSRLRAKAAAVSASLGLVSLASAGTISAASIAGEAAEPKGTSPASVGVVGCASPTAQPRIVLVTVKVTHVGSLANGSCFGTTTPGGSTGPAPSKDMATTSLEATVGSSCTVADLSSSCSVCHARCATGGAGLRTCLVVRTVLGCLGLVVGGPVIANGTIG